LPHQWKVSIIVPIYSYKKGDKTDYSNYRGTSLLPTTYKILSKILVSSLTLYIDEITGDQQYGFQYNILMTDQVFSIHQTLEKKWEYNGTVHQLLTESEKACDSVRREALILTDFCIPVTLIRLQVFEKRVLRRISELKRQEVVGGWRRLQMGSF
jgi:hypothetical protein